jgi:hypothetical protein
VHTSTAICNYGSSVGVLLQKVSALYLLNTTAAAESARGGDKCRSFVSRRSKQLELNLKHDDITLCR